MRPHSPQPQHQEIRYLGFAFVVPQNFLFSTPNPNSPLAAPLRLYLPLAPKTLGAEPFFQNPSLFRRRRRFKIGAARRPCPGTLSEGGPTSGSLSIAMDAS